MRVLSWNLHATPVTDRTSERVETAAATITDLRPDVVLLQEVWRPGDTRRIVDTLGAGYLIVDNPAAGLLLRKSGLMTCVRRQWGWRVLDTRFHEFRAEAPDWKIWEADGLGSKGVLTTTLARGTQRLALLNTHLQSAYSSSRYADIRARQVEELWVETERIPLAVPVIAAGDLNTLPSEPLYGTLERQWIDLGRTTRRTCRCGTSFLPDGGEGGWIDYILTRRTAAWQSRVAAFELIRNVRSDVPYSDHHGLLATVELARRVSVSNPAATLLLAATIPRAKLSRRTWLKTTILGLSGYRWPAS